MERELSGEPKPKTDLELCHEKLCGQLNIGTLYYHSEEDSEEWFEPVKDYFQERSDRIAAGEDTWVAHNFSSPTERTFDFYSGGEFAGDLTLDLVWYKATTRDRSGESILSETDNLIEAVASVEGLLARTA